MKTKSIIFLFVGVLIIIIVSSFLIEGVVNELVGLGWVGPGIMQIKGTNPQVYQLYINNAPLSATPLGPSVNGQDDSNKTYILNATVFDVNGDCDGGFTWYICTNDTLIDTGGICKADSGFYTYSVSNSSPAVKFPDSVNGIYCNFTANFNLEYYRYCGMSKINGTARDASNLQNSSTQYWKYNGFVSSLFPYVGNSVTNPAGLGSEINFGDVFAGIWNEGKGPNITKNGGNVHISLIWNASNFTGPTPFDIYVIEPPTNTTFAVDNTSIRSDGAGYINETEYYKITYPNYDLMRCDNYLCTLDEDSGINWANFTLWWHINIPTVLPGQYQNMIELNASQATVCE